MTVMPPPIRDPSPKVDHPIEDVDALRSRDAAAWAAVYDAYVNATYAFVAHLVGGDRAVAEELHQEIWLVAMSGIDQFAPDRGAFRGWLFGIARRRVALHFRKSGQRLDDAALRAISLDDRLLPGDALEAVEQNDAIRAALSELDDDAREAVVGKYIDSLSVAEIARRLDRTEKAVESLLSRTRGRLRHLLGRYLPAIAAESA